jgi:hypothetical protein
MLSPLQTVAGGVLLGCVAIAFPDRDEPLPAQQSHALCAETEAPESYLPVLPAPSACALAAEKKLAAR